MPEEDASWTEGLLLDPDGQNLKRFEETLQTSIRLFRLWWKGLGVHHSPIPNSDEVKELISVTERELKSSPFPGTYTLVEQCIKLLFRNVRFDKNNMMNVHPTPLLPSVVASVFTMLQNPNNLSSSTSPATTVMEEDCINYLAELIGFRRKSGQTEFGGNLVSCGSLSNLTALMVARENAQERSARSRPGSTREPESSGSPRRIVVTSNAAHISVQKAVRILGLGDRSLVKIPAASDAEIAEFEKSGTPMKLKPSKENYWKEIEKIQKTSNIVDASALVIAAVPTLGTVTTGTIEPIQPLIDMKKELGFHLHVDAAIGGLALGLDEVRCKASGVEQADSVTIDPHKLGYLHYPCSAIIFRRKSDLDTIALGAPYLEHSASTIEGSRPGTSAAGLWVALKTLGADGYNRIIGKCIELTRYLARRLVEEGFQALHEVDLNTICFSVYADGVSRRKLNRLTSELHARMMADGAFLLGKVEDISGVMVKDTPWLADSEKVSLVAMKVWIMNPDTSESDIETLVNELLRKKREIC